MRWAQALSCLASPCCGFSAFVAGHSIVQPLRCRRHISQCVCIGIHPYRKRILEARREAVPIGDEDVLVRELRMCVDPAFPTVDGFDRGDRVFVGLHSTAQHSTGTTYQSRSVVQFAQLFSFGSE